jgi:hypothetical protein
MRGMAGEKRRLRFPTLIHLISVLLWAALCAVFLVKHSHAIGGESARHHARERNRTSFAVLEDRAHEISRSLRLLAGDAFFGVAGLVLLWTGSRPYVRRLETWLEARSSGDAMALGSNDLSAQAIAANDDRGGVLR